MSEQIKHFGTQYKEDVYFFEENAKYVSSNILKISVISRVRSTSKLADIFNIRDETFFSIYKKKKIVNFLLIFSVTGKKLTFA